MWLPKKNICGKTEAHPELIVPGGLIMVANFVHGLCDCVLLLRSSVIRMNGRIVVKLSCISMFKIS